MDKQTKFNSTYLKIVFLVLTFILIVQLFHIQVLENSQWSQRSATKNELRQTFQASRGNVFFVDGSPLAINETVYGVFAMPDNFQSSVVKKKGITKEVFIEEVANETSLDKSILLERLSDPKVKYVSLAVKVSKDTIDQLKKKFPVTLGIWTYEDQTRRIYPNKDLAAKIIGFLGKNDDGNDIGRYGVEGYFDGVLKGSAGVFAGKKDSKNQVIVNENFDNVSSRNGTDITLTIDRGIQQMLEEELMKGLDRFKAKEAVAVIMEPYSGRILAMADLPTYNPNEYWKGEKVDCAYEYYSVNNELCNPKPSEVNQADKNNQDIKDNKVYFPEGYENRLKELQDQQQKLREEEDKLKQQQSDEINLKLAKFPPAVQEVLRQKQLPLNEIYRNSANSYSYEPGSVMKLITLAIAYNAKAIPRDPNFQLGSHRGCELYFDVKLCTASKKPVSSLTVKEMLLNSDNIGALRISQKVDKEEFAKTLMRFGLGKATGIELADESVFQAKDPKDWSFIDEYTAAYGQGSVSFTPIQLVNAWNIIASGGKEYRPTIVKSINDNGKTKDFKADEGDQVISPDAARDALSVGAEATRDTTFKRSKEFYSKYPFVGKTGTANIPDTNGAGYLKDVVNTTFLGIAPYDNPRFTMMVWYREPRASVDSYAPNGSNTSEITWLNIAEKLMLYLHIAPKI